MSVKFKKNCLNSSVLNYPKTCVGKKNFTKFQSLNYPKTCFGKKKLI